MLRDTKRNKMYILIHTSLTYLEHCNCKRHRFIISTRITHTTQWQLTKGVRDEVIKNDPKIQQKKNGRRFSPNWMEPKSKDEQENSKVLCNRFIAFPILWHIIFI